MKKLLSLALVLVMILALVPAAHADLIDTTMGLLVKNSNANANGAGLYSYARSGNLIIFKFSGDYFNDLYELAADDEDYKELWDEIAEIIAEESKSLQDGVTSLGAVLIDCVVSADDPSVVLLAATNGEIIVDKINGISIFATSK